MKELKDKTAKEETGKGCSPDESREGNKKIFLHATPIISIGTAKTSGAKPEPEEAPKGKKKLGRKRFPESCRKETMEAWPSNTTEATRKLLEDRPRVL